MESDVFELGPGEVGLFGYGSLLLQSSMERTLGRKYEGKHSVCHLKNWRRTWDSLYPNELFYFMTEDGQRCYPKNIVYLNVTRSPGLLNGVLYAIAEEDLAGFDRREAFYSRTAIEDELADLRVRGGPAFLYTGLDAYLLKGEVPIAEAAIRRSYVQLVESGLEELGPAFRATYQESTDEPPLASVIDDRIDLPV